MRQNRVAHIPAGVVNNNVDTNFPYPFSHARLPFQSGIAMGEDVVMDQVLAFDIRVYDPQARNLRAPTLDTALTPGDPGYESAVIGGARVVGLGAYVDLGYAQPYTITNNASVCPTMPGNEHFFLAPDPNPVKKHDAAAVAANEPQILSVWQLPHV